MGPLPRPRQTCGPPAGIRRPIDDVLLLELEEEGEVNRAVLSGLIAAEPQRDRSRDGDPITVVLVSFAAPDEGARHGSACCEVEIPDRIADRHRRRLCVGRRILALGRLTGAGGLWASSIWASETRPAAD